MTAVMIGEENKRVFRLANAALTEKVWNKLEKAGAVNWAQKAQDQSTDTASLPQTNYIPRDIAGFALY